MEQFTAKKFSLGDLKGISAKNIEEHLKLYAGYVLNTNTVLKKINELSEGGEDNMGIISGLQRRLQFEYNGMKNHEYYFAQFENGAKNIGEASEFYKKVVVDFGSFAKWLSNFKMLATMRGVGWAMLYYDKENDLLINSWVDEQHLGQLNGCKTILALDMWEHAYVYDFPTSEKKKYIEAFFENLNWSVIEENYLKAK